MTGDEAPAGVHWSAIREFAFGDIKCIWELSRFSWAFALARAYARTHEERYADAFWALFDDWLEHNPPNRGPNWMCGQEATFRLMAACFARNIFRAAPASTPERAARFRAFVVVSGRRIAANFNYALSQANNHGISEAVGLITAGILVPDHPEAMIWKRRGIRALESQIAALVYADGAFAQHSANYHRVVLHDLFWCIAVLQQTGGEIPSWLNAGALRALEFIAALVNPETGAVPMYGANDGTNALPLADGDYTDFRPLMQAGAALLAGRRWLPRGPWDEAAGWLAGRAVLPADLTPLERTPTRIWPQGGIAQIANGPARLDFRCPARFRHRPSQADLLHVDVEWRGIRITHEAGTYSYNACGPWSSALAQAAVHNSVTINAEEPMRRVSRFLYLPWPSGSVRWNADGFIEATHNGWRRLAARHTRSVQPAGPGQFIVRDQLACAVRRRIRLHWLLADLPHTFEPAASRLVLDTAAGKYVVSWSTPEPTAASLVRADPASDRGWWSPRYFQALPALSLAIEFDVIGDAVAATRFSPEP